MKIWQKVNEQALKLNICDRIKAWLFWNWLFEERVENL